MQYVNGFTLTAAAVAIIAAVVLALLIRESPTERARGYPPTSPEARTDPPIGH